MEEIIKEAYFANMANYYLEKKCTGPWSRVWVQTIIQMLNTIDDIIIRKWSIYESNLRDVYIIKLRDDKYELMRVLKSTDNTVHTVPVVPWEDSFDIIWKAHIACEHGNITQTMNLIKSSYFINLIFVALLIKACNCQKENIVSDIVHYNIEGSLQILDMTEYHNEEFNYVLIYNDTQTRLIQLRPLGQVSELEISMELVKIFTDLGPPRKLVVYEPYFYDKVIENVNKVFNPCKIELELDVILKENQINNRLYQVSLMLQSWMKMNIRMNWVVGCNFVQRKMNGSNENKNPYNLVFGNSINAKNKKSLEDTLKIVADSFVSKESNVNKESNAICLSTDTYDGDKDVSQTQSEMDICFDDTKENVMEEYTDSQLNLHAEQSSSYQKEFLQFTADYVDKDVAKSFKTNFTSLQQTEVNNCDEDIAMVSDLEFDNKNNIKFEVDINNENILGQNDIEITPNILIKNELLDDTQEKINMSYDKKHEKMIETMFVCWKCEKEVSCSKMHDDTMDIMKFICQSCIKVEETST